MTWSVSKIAYTQETYTLKCWTADESHVKASLPISASTDYQTENQKFGTWIKGLKDGTHYTCTVEASNSVGSTVAPIHVAFKTQRVAAAAKFGESKQVTEKYYSIL